MRLKTGNFLARMAEGPADLARAQELRHLCFLAARGLCRPGARDQDRFDALCSHVLVEDAQNGRLLACFRAQILSPAGMSGSYSGQYYDLSRLQDMTGQTMELGRFCSHPGVHDPEVLRLAWAAIARLVDDHGVSLMYGCSSFSGADAGLHANALAYLGQHHVAPLARRPGRKAAQIVEFPGFVPDPVQARADLPPLLRGYLGMGGWVSDHAVVDDDLDTLHVFTGLEVACIPPARARALRALAGQGQA